jgi:hypothetical protein
MKKSKIFFFSILTLVSIYSFTVATDWYLFENTFSTIEFPAKPVLNTQGLPSAVGKLKMETAFLEPTDKNVYLYGLLVSEYPDSLINSDKKEKLAPFFRSAIDGSIKDTKSKLLSEKEISIEKYPGREVRMDYGNGKAIVTMRLYLIKNKMTIVQIITPTVILDSVNKYRFLNSFKLK